jgi:hypothetical protein
MASRIRLTTVPPSLCHRLNMLLLFATIIVALEIDTYRGKKSSSCMVRNRINRTPVYTGEVDVFIQISYRHKERNRHLKTSNP